MRLQLVQILDDLPCKPPADGKDQMFKWKARVLVDGKEEDRTVKCWGEAPRTAFLRKEEMPGAADDPLKFPGNEIKVFVPRAGGGGRGGPARDPEAERRAMRAALMGACALSVAEFARGLPEETRAKLASKDLTTCTILHFRAVYAVVCESDAPAGNGAGK